MYSPSLNIHPPSNTAHFRPAFSLGPPSHASTSAQSQSQRESVAPSPTSSVFEENNAATALLDEVTSWDEARVGDWLESVKAGAYATMFIENDITGETLLEIDQEALKELGITKVGDRIRILVAVKSLRQRCFTHITRPRLHHRPSSVHSSVAMEPSNSGMSLNNRNGPRTSMAYSHIEPFGPGRGSSPSTSTISPHSPCPPPTPGMLSSGSSFPNLDYPSRPLSPGSMSSNPRAPSRSVRAEPRQETHIMSINAVKESCVKFIYLQGQTRIVNISSCHDTPSILAKALKKFAISATDQPLNPAQWCVYTVTTPSDIDPAASSYPLRLLPAVEVVAICKDPTRPERERLILCRRGEEPGQEEIKRANGIAREQSEQREKVAISANYAAKMRKLEGFFGERPVSSISSTTPTTDSAPILAPPPTGQGKQNGERSAGSATKRLRMLFGQRPPSELISSNLQEYFPGHSQNILEQTVRNSIRHSQRMSSISSFQTPYGHGRRFSASSGMSGMSGMSGRSGGWKPGVASIGEAWISQGLKPPPRPKRPVSLRRVIVPTSVPVNGGIGSSLYRHRLESGTSLATYAEADEEEEQEEDDRDSDVKSLAQSMRSLKAPSLMVTSEEDEIEEEDEDEEGTLRAMKYSEGYQLGTVGEVVPGDETTAEEVFAAENGNGKIDGEEWGHEEEDSAVTEDEDGETEVEGEGEGLDKIEIEVADDHGPRKWMKGALIGKGSFGSVYLGLNALSGELMAVKQVELPKGDVQGEARKRGMIDALQREMSLLRDLEHENIVRYLGSSSDDTHLNIFLEYVPGGSIAELLNKYGAFEEPLIRNFVRQILQGLNYLHERDIIHRDIKGANVLVDNKGGIKISDFGISKKVEANLLSSAPGMAHGHRPSLQGSVFWMAPEVVKQTSYTRKADIWSLGCLILEMITASHPYPTYTQMQAIFKIGSSCAPDIPKEISAEAKDFLGKTFELDHTKRPSAEELLHHPFLATAM
ncbi:ATP binding [Saitoella coloradoensis]